MATTKKSSNTTESSEKPRFLLTDLKPAKGAVKDRLRVGRGRASGAGKTCNRGHNGEGQRSGLGKKLAFEGGQMPLFRRLPRIDGFELINQRKWVELNVQDIETLLPTGEEELSYEKLELYGIFNPKRFDGVRILGNGEIKRKVIVEAHHVSPSAKAKIEAAGGQVKLLGAKAE